MSSVSISPVNSSVAVPNNGTCHRLSRSSGDRSLVRALFRSLASVRKQSPPVQITAGAGGGIVAGYVFGKTSKMFAFIVGSTIIFLQFAECKGYLQIQNGKLKEDFDVARDKLGEMIDGMNAIGSEAVVEMVGGKQRNSGKELLKLVADNARFLYGLFGGILVGFGIS